MSSFLTRITDPSIFDVTLELRHDVANDDQSWIPSRLAGTFDFEVLPSTLLVSRLINDKDPSKGIQKHPTGDDGVDSIKYYFVPNFMDVLETAFVDGLIRNATATGDRDNISKDERTQLIITIAKQLWKSSCFTVLGGRDNGTHIKIRQSITSVKKIGQLFNKAWDASLEDPDMTSQVDFVITPFGWYTTCDGIDLNPRDLTHITTSHANR